MRDPQKTRTTTQTRTPSPLPLKGEGGHHQEGTQNQSQTPSPLPLKGEGGRQQEGKQYASHSTPSLTGRAGGGSCLPSLTGRAGGESSGGESTEPRAVAEAFSKICDGSYADLERGLELLDDVQNFAEENRGSLADVRAANDSLRKQAEGGDKLAIFSLYCSCLHAQNVLWQLANHSRCITMLDARCETMANILRQDIINLKEMIEHEKD